MNYNSNENPTIENVIMMAMAEALRNTHTNVLAKVTKVNTKTINCRPVISRVVNNNKIDLPEFSEVPILNFLGGTSSIQMPIAVGDYCILFISERCFDTWYNGQDFERPLVSRIHDYSDAIAFVGIKNKAGELDIPTVITMLGDTYQEGDYEHLGNRTQTGNYDLTGDILHAGDTLQEGDYDLTGNMTISAIMQAANVVITTGIKIENKDGVTGSFLTADGKTVTVTKGLITNIV